MVFKLILAKIGAAREGNVEAAIGLLEDLNKSLKGEAQLDESVRKYFIECLTHLLNGISKNHTDHQVQTLTARSFNLVKKKGRREPSRVGAEIGASIRIHNLRVQNPNMNIDEIVMLFMSTDEKYAQQYKGGKTDSLVKKYRLHKKKFGWNDSEMWGVSE